MRRIAAFLLPLPALGMLGLVALGSPLSADASTAPHIMVIAEENAAFDNAIGSPFIIGDSKAPYINSLASQYVSATQWFSVQHVSQFAYRELIAGSPLSGQSQPFKATSVVHELAGAGFSWKAYMESAPGTTCAGDGASSGRYDEGHDPFVHFKDVVSVPSQCSRVEPYSRSGLSSDLNSSSAPDFVWITPNLCDDMHTSCGGNKVAQGDTWLKSNLPTVLSSSWYKTGGVVIVTWDESITSDTSGGSLGSGGHIATLVISSNNKGHGAFSSSGDHYGTLRGIEEAYGVGLLGNSANASFGDLKPAF